MPCDKKAVKADVVFIWDGSGAMDEQAEPSIYEYILAFLRPFEDVYGPNGVQAALVVYEKKVTQTIRFNEAKTLVEFKKLLDERGVDEGNGDKAGIDDALRVTTDEILNEKNGSRGNVYKMVVFFATQRYTGPNPAARAALLRQHAELYVVSLDSTWKLSDKQLLDLAGDWTHVYQFNDVNAMEGALAATLPFATWRAFCDGALQTFFVHFVDDSTEFSDEFNQEGSAKRKELVQNYREKLSSVYQHSLLKAAVIDVFSFERADNNKTRVLTRTTFKGYTSALEGKGIESATEYLASKQSWRNLEAVLLH
jgi:hypothetical protein